MTEKQTGMAIHFKAPSKVLTDNEGYGDHSRLRVDIGSTGFFAGKEFRAFWPISLASGASRVFKLVSEVDWIVYQVQLELAEGYVLAEIAADGTEGGTFGTAVLSRARNYMTVTPSFTSQVAITTGGTLTGYGAIDQFYTRSAGATAQAASTTGAALDEKGVAPGTYYIVLTNVGTGTATGTFRMRWEERV